MNPVTTINGQPVNVVMDILLSEYGPLEQGRAVPEERIEPLVRKVPSLLIDLWRTHGVGALRERRLWLAMPGSLDAAAAIIFSGDPDLGDGTTIVAYGAMGNMLCWNATHGPVLVVPAAGAVQAPRLLRPSERRPDNEELLYYLTELHPFFFDRVDRKNEPLLTRAEESLGPLSAGEIYASYPVQTLGEGIGLENIQVDDASIYLTEVAARVKFILQDYEGGRYNIREIGTAK